MLRYADRTECARAMVKSCVLATVILLLQAPEAARADPASFPDLYIWVYRTGKDVTVDVPAATCLGLKTPQSVYERAWVAPDARVHAIKVGEDRQNPFVVLSVQHSLEDLYNGSFWLATKDGRLLGTCNSPFINASYVAVKDGSLDAKFQSEKTYFLTRFDQRAKWDTFVPVKRSYP